MRLQSTPQIEEVIRSGFVSIMAQEIDRVALAGSGSSNQPTGILNQAGIGSVAIGTNGGAITMDKLLDLRKEVAIDNGNVANGAYVVNAKTENAISQLKDSNNQYLLPVYGAELGKQQLASRRLVVTNGCPSNLSKGSGTNLSAAIFGDFSDLYDGTWGEMEILVDQLAILRRVRLL